MVEGNRISHQAGGLFFDDHITPGMIGGGLGIVVNRVCTDLPGDLRAAAEPVGDRLGMGTRHPGRQEPKRQKEEGQDHYRMAYDGRWWSEYERSHQLNKSIGVMGEKGGFSMDPARADAG